MSRKSQAIKRASLCSSSAQQQKETLPPRTINQEQEDEIIKILEMQQRQKLEQNPMKELEEALMDRTTASLNRR